MFVTPVSYTSMTPPKFTYGWVIVKGSLLVLINDAVRTV